MEFLNYIKDELDKIVVIYIFIIVLLKIDFRYSCMDYEIGIFWGK